MHEKSEARRNSDERSLVVFKVNTIMGFYEFVQTHWSIELLVVMPRVPFTTDHALVALVVFGATLCSEGGGVQCARNGLSQVHCDDRSPSRRAFRHRHSHRPIDIYRHVDVST